MTSFQIKSRISNRRIKCENTLDSPPRLSSLKRSLKLRGLMASPLICSQAALNHSIAFVPENRAALLLTRFSALPKLTGVTAGSRLEMRPTPEMVSTGIHAIDRCSKRQRQIQYGTRPATVTGASTKKSADPAIANGRLILAPYRFGN